MPTAMNVKEEKKAKTNIVRFETSTSPNWKDIKMFIRKNFFSHLPLSHRYRKIKPKFGLGQYVFSFQHSGSMLGRNELGVLF